MQSFVLLLRVQVQSWTPEANKYLVFYLEETWYTKSQVYKIHKYRHAYKYLKRPWTCKRNYLWILVKSQPISILNVLFNVQNLDLQSPEDTEREGIQSGKFTHEYFMWLSVSQRGHITLCQHLLWNSTEIIILTFSSILWVKERESEKNTRWMVWAQVGSFQARVYYLHENPFTLAKSPQRQLPGCWRHSRNYPWRKPKKASGIPSGYKQMRTWLGWPILTCVSILKVHKTFLTCYWATSVWQRTTYVVPSPIIWWHLAVRLLAWVITEQGKTYWPGGSGEALQTICLHPRGITCRPDPCRALTLAPAICQVGVLPHPSGSLLWPRGSERMTWLLCSSVPLWH